MENLLGKWKGGTHSKSNGSDKRVYVDKYWELKKIKKRKKGGLVETCLRREGKI